MPNQVGPAPPFLELSADFPLSTPARVPGLQRREQEWRVQSKATPRFTTPCRSPAPTCSTSQIERASPGSTTSSTELERHPQGVNLHPFCVNPADTQGKRHQSLGRDQAGQNNGKSCFSQRGGNGEGGSQWDVADRGQQRRKGQLPTPA